MIGNGRSGLQPRLLLLNLRWWLWLELLEVVGFLVGQLIDEDVEIVVGQLTSALADASAAGRG
jgi:hypothetical protein